jgi:uncharacterized delta-60 repeat protein
MKIIIAFIFFSLNAITYSQVNQEWLVRESGTGANADYAYSIAVDASGNVYITGSMISSGTSNDYTTIKYNSAGVQLWISKYNGPANSIDIPRSLVIDGSGNVYVTGSSSNTSGANNDYATIKYNSAGVQQWAVRYNGPGNSHDDANAIAIDVSGNVYVTGTSEGGASGKDYATVKYNSSGIEQWVSRYSMSGSFPDIARSIAADVSGYIYVTGESPVSGSDVDYATIKYNTSGVQQWAERYNGTGNTRDYGYALVLDAANIYVTGTSNGNYATIKYNSSGVQQWLTKYIGPVSSGDGARLIQLDNLGNIYVSGTSVSSGINNDYLTVKYNASGVQQWTARYDGPGNGADLPYSMAVDGPGNVYITGYSTLSGVNFDCTTVKYNASGTQQWVQRYNGPANTVDVGYSTAVDGLGNVYVTGSSNGTGTGSDFITIKYSQVTGIQQINHEVPGKFSLSQNYPNPFNPVTNIEFSVPKSAFVNLIVYDISGREVETLVNQNMSAGIYKADWDASKYSSGMYLYTITAGNFRETKKMLLIK